MLPGMDDFNTIAMYLRENQDGIHLGMPGKRLKSSLYVILSPASFINSSSATVKFPRIDPLRRDSRAIWSGLHAERST
jgi:hypothetical protein